MKKLLSVLFSLMLIVSAISFMGCKKKAAEVMVEEDVMMETEGQGDVVEGEAMMEETEMPAEKAVK
ncbi:MAG: hypothetical protein ABH857_01860 [Elusimicrobiota bacterium]